MPQGGPIKPKPKGNNTSITSPKVSKEAAKAAEKLESWVQHLEKFEPYKLKNPPGADIIRNFTMGMHPRDFFHEGKDLTIALRQLAGFKDNMEERVLGGENVMAKKIDKETTSEEMVDRWKYFGAKLRAKEETEHLESELYKCLEGMALALEELDERLKACVRK